MSTLDGTFPKRPADPFRFAIGIPCCSESLHSTPVFGRYSHAFDASFPNNTNKNHTFATRIESLMTSHSAALGATYTHCLKPSFDISNLGFTLPIPPSRYISILYGYNHERTDGETPPHAPPSLQRQHAYLRVT